jgi:CelD/BcsL family acetyltransferase involved in cellulose biosynthesis
MLNAPASSELADLLRFTEVRADALARFALAIRRMDIVDHIGALEALAPEWQELWDRDPAATVFQSPDWLIPWTRHLWGGGKLRVITQRSGSKLTGVAPLFIWGEGRVAWLGAGISDYLGITCAPECADVFARGVLETLVEMRHEWERCDLEELREDSPLLRVAPPRGLAAHVEECSVCPARPIDERLPTRLAKNLRYARKKLGSLEFVPGEWDDLFRLHEARWEGHGVLGSADVQAFHREAAARFVRLYALRVNGEVIAVQYNLVGKERACCYLSGFNPEWHAYSPGAVLLEQSMEEAGREGARVFDFLRQREAYKYDWGARDQINRRLVLMSAASVHRPAAIDI